MTSKIFWRKMSEMDIEDAVIVSDSVHDECAESEDIFFDRYELYPEGCYVLDSPEGVLGYALSHPWHLKELPELNDELGELPEKPEAYYIHDVAILPEGQGGGYARDIVSMLAKQAVINGLP